MLERRCSGSRAAGRWRCRRRSVSSSRPSSQLRPGRGARVRCRCGVARATPGDDAESSSGRPVSAYYLACWCRYDLTCRSSARGPSPGRRRRREVLGVRRQGERARQEQNHQVDLPRPSRPGRVLRARPSPGRGREAGRPTDHHPADDWATRSSYADGTTAPERAPPTIRCCSQTRPTGASRT